MTFKEHILQGIPKALPEKHVFPEDARIQDVDEDIAESIDGLDRAAGAVVTGVPEGPSKDAGILQGDVIVIFDGHEVEDVRDLVQTVGNTEVGKAVDVVVVRDGAQVTLSVTRHPDSAEPHQSNKDLR